MRMGANEILSWKLSSHFDHCLHSFIHSFIRFIIEKWLLSWWIDNVLQMSNEILFCTGVQFNNKWNEIWWNIIVYLSHCAVAHWFVYTFFAYEKCPWHAIFDNFFPDSSECPHFIVLSWHRAQQRIHNEFKKEQRAIVIPAPRNVPLCFHFVPTWKIAST